MINEILLLTALLALSAFFSGSETALFSISDIKVRKLLKEKRRGSKTLSRIKSDSSMLLTTILIGNNIVNISASAIATIIAVSVYGKIGTGMAIGILTVLILVFGEVFPKSIAYNNAEKISLIVAKPIRFMMILFWPIAKIFSIANEKMTKNVDKTVTEEDVKIALTMGEESGSIESDEKKMIHNIFEFSDTHISQIMTPRDDIAEVSSDETIENVIEIMVKEGFSRLPVYEGEKDNIIGIVSVRDLLKYIKKPSEMKDKINKDDIKPVLFAPRKQKLDSLINNLRKRKYNMAVVVDDNGIVQGIATIEDLVEEIVGEIYDEYDEDESCVKKINKNTFIVEGKAKLIDLKKRFGIILTEKEISNVSGFITDKIERLPSKGEIIDSGHFILTVLEVTDKEILKIKIERK